MPREKLRTVISVISFIMLLLLFFTLPSKTNACGLIAQVLQ